MVICVLAENDKYTVTIKGCVPFNMTTESEAFLIATRNGTKTDPIPLLITGHQFSADLTVDPDEKWEYTIRIVNGAVVQTLGFTDYDNHFAFASNDPKPAVFYTPQLGI